MIVKIGRAGIKFLLLADGIITEKLIKLETNVRISEFGKFAGYS